MQRRTFQLTIAIITLLSVAAVFISPAVDLEPTAMRALRAAKLTGLALLMAAAVVAGMCGGTESHDTGILFTLPISAGPDLFDLLCSHLC